MAVDVEQIKSLIDYLETQAEQQRHYIKTCLEGEIYTSLAEYAASERAYQTCVEQLKQVIQGG